MPPPRHVGGSSGPSRVAVLRRWEELEWWSCAYCDSPFSEKVVAEVDHIRPLAKGGLDTWINLNPSCRQCNASKADTDVEDWIIASAGQVETECDPSVTQRYREALTTRAHALHM
ncbi:HNH endonuclease [Streptomyces zaomyceticus]|uniref:HNH endonuclease n=1 Tax=Streptomyces zaomyceticus TaxID=68286 RepID=UPI00341282E2